MTIEEKFGTGMPSGVDDVLADRNDDEKFYLIKQGMVWKSTDRNLDDDYPKPMNEVFPGMICNLTAATLGHATDDRYYAADDEVFWDSSDVLYDKGLLCNGAW